MDYTASRTFVSWCRLGYSESIRSIESILKFKEETAADLHLKSWLPHQFGDMYPTTWLTLFLISSCFLLLAVAKSSETAKDSYSPLDRLGKHSENEAHVREKRTLFLKKKLVGAGILGFGLGLIKGYKSAGYHIPPKVHHIYLSSPASAPVAYKYVDYVGVGRGFPLAESTVIHKISPLHSSW